MPSNRHEIESIQGAKLLCIADFHVGAEFSAMALHPALSVDTKPAQSTSTISKGYYRTGSINGAPFGSRYIKSSMTKSCLICGSLEGGVGILLPVDEKVFKRLNLLQHMMIMTLPSTLGLNPKDYRLLKSTRYRFEKKKGILDGNILWKFISLSSELQDDLAASMGSSTDIVLENLLDMQILYQFF